MTKNRESARDKILRVAIDLFYQEGIRAVGIDRIILEAGVTKASLYRHFATKDDLVAAYLDYRQSMSILDLEEARRKYPDSCAKQLHSLIDGLVARMKGPDFRGCPFMNTAIEFAEPDHPSHRRAVEGTNENWERIAQLSSDAGASEPMELAEQLRILCNGAMMVAYMNKSTFNPEHFSKTAHWLVESHLPQSGGK